LVFIFEAAPGVENGRGIEHSVDAFLDGCYVVLQS
jgi:hypothetical protein